MTGCSRSLAARSFLLAGGLLTLACAQHVARKDLLAQGAGPEPANGATPSR
jgi:hypothetical protein